MMDINEVRKNPIKLVSTFSTALKYMIAGILLTSITFNFEYIAYIQSVFSAVCFYLGLRLIKKINKSFQIAYYISIYILIATTVCNLLLMVSPVKIPANIDLFNYSLNIMKIIFISVGLNVYVKSNQNIVFGSLYVLLQILGILFQADNVNFMVAITFLILIFFIVRSLWKCKNEVKEVADVKIIPAKIPSSIFIGIWIVILLGGSVMVNYIWPLFTYHYIDQREQNYQLYQIVDEKTDLDFFDKVTVYNFSKEEYMLVCIYQKTLDTKYSALDIKITTSTPRGYNITGFPPKLYVKDKKGILETTNIIDTIINSGDILFENRSDIRRTYLNPASNDIEIIIDVFVPKVIFNEEIDYVYNHINLGFQKYGKFFDAGKNNPLSEGFMINKNGKIVDESI